ncbi:ethanolamine-phosphate cytidylyltransferase-like isoform X1 [Lineus longissimus]|uniref:ethanolamine-phosphate cytidylyltransferase-like isoform X1 n=1 Tax=Lineus longissimus TaxID=88925 RepID=UPI002B4E020D
MAESSEKKPVRVYIDGCFDMVHFGHANAIRQAKQLGDHLTVGVHCDEEITKHKGPPVYTEQERYTLIRAIKWVDEVKEAAPYFCSMELLDENNLDFVAHGDDVTVSAATGVDVYDHMKKSGRYKEFNRTTGVSTTDIVGRMLLLTKAHHQYSEDNLNKDEVGEIGQTQRERIDSFSKEPMDNSTKSPYTGTSQFLATSKKIIQFSSGKDPKPGDRIVYVAGAFDLLHVGHVNFLEAASKKGDFLIVGLHTDLIVNRYKGSNYPIMNLNERVLSILSCKFVSEVVIGAPYTVTQQMMDHFSIDLVCHGITKISPDIDGIDPYEIPKKADKFLMIQSNSTLTTEMVVERIIRHRLDFETRNRIKQEREVQKINEKKMLDEQ